jgi:large subunit ribosomal protein L4e
MATPSSSTPKPVGKGAVKPAAPKPPAPVASSVAVKPAARPAPEGHVHRVPVLSLEGKPGEQVQLPSVFSGPVRTDLVQRAVRAAQANRRQAYGPSRKAGMRHSVEWSGKGHGVARTPRLMSGNTGAQAPNTVGGRAAHPPRPDAIWTQKINVKERRRALAAALAATREVRFAIERGHEVPAKAHLPFVLEDALEDVSSASQAREVLQATGLWADVERAASGIHIRAGKGKVRGRVRRHPRSLLLVVTESGRARGFRNFPGVDVVPLDSLGTEHLAPGGAPGRLTLFTPRLLKKLEERFGASLAGASLPTRPALPAPTPRPGGAA